MAKITLNSGIEMIQGAIGRWVYKKGGIVSRLSSSTRPPTEIQLAHRAQFRDALEYAQRAIKAPATAGLYAQLAPQRGPRVRPVSVAVGDWFNVPTIGHVDLAGFSRAAGSVIGVVASDDVAVVSVHVAIHDSANALLEQGAATEGDAGWQYQTTTVLPSDDDLTIVVTAKDHPGNETQKAVPVPAPTP